MSKPLSPMQPVTFEDRLKLVQAEVMARTANTPANERNGHRARLWCAWIQKNVLDVPAVAMPASSMNKIDCDFFPWRTAEKSAAKAVGL